MFNVYLKQTSGNIYVFNVYLKQQVGISMCLTFILNTSKYHHVFNVYLKQQVGIPMCLTFTLNTKWEWEYLCVGISMCFKQPSGNIYVFNVYR